MICICLITISLLNFWGLKPINIDSIISILFITSSATHRSRPRRPFNDRVRQKSRERSNENGIKSPGAKSPASTTPTRLRSPTSTTPTRVKSPVTMRGKSPSNPTRDKSPITTRPYQLRSRTPTKPASPVRSAATDLPAVKKDEAKPIYTLPPKQEYVLPLFAHYFATNPNRYPNLYHSIVSSQHGAFNFTSNRATTFLIAHFENTRN